MPIPKDTLEIDAQGRENLVLDLALPILAAWTTSVRIHSFRPSMGVSGLSPRETARLRTLGLATSSRATGLFEGANDFRFAFPTDPERRAALGTPGVEADLAGHPLAPVISDLSVASFGLQVGRAQDHRLQGFTHTRGSDSTGFAARTLSRLGREFGVELNVSIDELGFEPQGLGSISMSTARDRGTGRSVDWKRTGDVRAIHVKLGGVRPKVEQLDRIEAAFKEALWDARRGEPAVTRQITNGVDQGAFIQVDVECEFGGATFVELISRSAAPLPLARRMVKRALGYLDSYATSDEVTGLIVLASAIAAGADFEMSLVPSEKLSAACSLLRDLGAYIEESEAPGLVLLKTSPYRN